MPTRRLPDPPEPKGGYTRTRPHCRHPEHDPPKMIVYKAGTYEHTCPACGHVTVFTVLGPKWSAA